MKKTKKRTARRRWDEHRRSGGSTTKVAFHFGNWGLHTRKMERFQHFCPRETIRLSMASTMAGSSGEMVHT